MTVLNAILIQLILKSTFMKQGIFAYEPSSDFFLTGKTFSQGGEY